jgi:hypothetical protein
MENLRLFASSIEHRASSIEHREARLETACGSFSGMHSTSSIVHVP